MKDRGYIKLVILYGIYFLGLGATGFTGVYLGGKGMSNSQIGLLMSIPPLIAFVFQPLWGMAGDRAKYKRSALSLCFLLSACACLLIDLSGSFLTLLVSFTAYNCVSQGMSPLAQSISIEYSRNTKYGFGPIRMAGSIAYQLMILLAGFILSDDMPELYRIVSACYLVSAAFSLAIPPVKGHQHDSEKLNPLSVLKDKKICFLLCMSLCGKTAGMFGVSFFNKYIQELFADNVRMSILAYTAIVLEIPFLLLAQRFMKRFKVTVWVLIGLAANAVRFVGIGLCTSFPLLIALQLLQVSVMACFEFYPSLYLDRRVRKELRGSMQSVNTLVTFGLSQITGSLLGGFIADAVGMQHTFLIYGLFLAVMCAVFFVPARRIDMEWQND